MTDTVEIFLKLNRTLFLKEAASQLGAGPKLTLAGRAEANRNGVVLVLLRTWQLWKERNAGVQT